MADMRYRYLVALSDSNAAEDLESLLNEKAGEGFELFMLHEVDSRSGKTQYNCIFYKIEEDFSLNGGESVDVSDITDFKSRIEKIYQKQDTHKEFVELQKKVVQIQKQINETKRSLENATDEKKRSKLNDKIQDKINELNDLNANIAKISDASKFYNRIKSDKITVYLSDELLELSEKENLDNLVARNIKLRQEITDKFGFVIPNIKYTDGINLEPYQYRIDIRDVPAASGFVYPSHKMFYKGQSNINRKPRNSIAALHPIYLFDVFWIKEEDTKNYWDKGISASDIIAMHLAYASIKYAHELLDYKDINNYIELVRVDNFDLVENLVPDIVSPGELRYLLANLIREMVPIKDIVNIFEKIMDLYTYASEKEILLEKLRISLKRNISYSRVDGNNSLDVITVDPEFDNFLSENIIESEHSNPIISLSKDEVAQLMSKTAGFIEGSNSKIDHTAVICSLDIRHALFGLFEEYIPGLAVLAHEEISNETELNEIGSLENKDLLKRKKTR